MGPEQRVVPRFAAEPPQEELPYGRWADRLARELLGAADGLDTEGEELGEVRSVTWYPDRTWHGWTYVPATAATSNGYELFGYVRFQRGATEEDDASAFSAHIDFTQETAERNPDWQLDICEEVVGSWHGEGGAEALMTLVWGRPLVPDGRVVTAELADLAVDQCIVVEQRFTLIAPDDYRGDLLDIKLYDERGDELARESLYAGGDEDSEEAEAD